MALPIVAIVGRPNVGKSTLVNRIAQTGDAIVHEMRGVTRDRSYHKADWNGVEFMLIDTGGIEMGGDDAFQGSIRAQAFEGAREADVIIFLVDGKAGINTDDEEVARILQKAGKPVFVAVNKMDNPARMDEVWEFYALGLGDPWPVSAQHGNGTGDLLDEVVNELRKVEVVPEEEVEAINVAIIGRPNAGKSSLTNKLTNNNRSIVSDVAGTTRDAIDTLVEHEGQMYRIVDTAGLRRKSQIDEDVEYYGFVGYAQVVANTALTGKRVDRIRNAIDDVYANYSRTIPTARLNTWLAGIRETGHTVSKGKAVLRMKYLTQTGTCPPHFTFFVNRPDVVDDNYERYLENRMREAFPLEGTPIRLKFKKKD